MAISDTNLSTTVFSAVKTAIISSAPYITNNTTSATSAASILAAYNDKKPDLPQIIINPIETEESTYRFGSQEGKKIINVAVDCYYKNTLGVDQLADQVIAGVKADIEDNTIVGMDLIGITTDFAFVDQKVNKFQLKSVVFTFDRE